MTLCPSTVTGEVCGWQRTGKSFRRRTSTFQMNQVSIDRVDSLALSTHYEARTFSRSIILTFIRPPPADPVGPWFRLLARPAFLKASYAHSMSIAVCAGYIQLISCLDLEDMIRLWDSERPPSWVIPFELGVPEYHCFICNIVTFTSSLLPDASTVASRGLHCLRGRLAV